MNPINLNTKKETTMLDHDSLAAARAAIADTENSPRVRQAHAADLLEQVRDEITPLAELREELVADLNRLGAGLRMISRISGLSTTAVTRIIRRIEGEGEGPSGSVDA